MKYPKLSIPILIVIWLLALLLADIFSPSYLVEGVRNTLGFSFPSKEAYAKAVWFVYGLYYISFALLVILTLRSVKDWLRIWRRRR